MAGWDSVPSWTPFEDINGGQQFEKRLSADDLNALAENIAYLYAHQGENEYLGDYADGNYRVGAIVKYSDGNIYMCIKDTDDQQEPTNATYWEMLNEEVESEGEVLPDYTDSDFTLHYNVGEGTGELDIVYSSSEKVAFEAAPEGAVIDTLQDQNFVSSNIKKDVEIFGVTGEYEGEGGGDLPQLYAPTLSLNGDALIITENASNGSFTKSYDLYIDGSLVGNYTSTTIDLTTLELEDGKYSITVRAKGTNFAESADSVTIEYGVGLYLAGTYDANGTMLKSWEQLKTEFPEAFETEGVLGTKPYNNGYVTSEHSIFKSLFNNACHMVVISDEITTIGDKAFASSSPSKVKIPNTVTSIGNDVFKGSTSNPVAITEINIPRSVKSIGTNGFRQAEKLASVILNEGLESIGDTAFYACSALTSLVLPASVKIIGSQALFNLTTATFLGTPEGIATNAFGTTLKTLNVPWAEGEVADAPWGATNATINYNYVAEG